MPPKSGTKTEGTKAKPGAKPKKPVTPTELAYPDFKVEMFTVGGKNPLTADDAKELLGWQEEQEGEGTEKFGTDYLLLDHNGKKVRCKNNTANRPYSESTSKVYSQEMLNQRWKGLNSETYGIGKSGQVITGQHRLISLVLAEQMRTSEDEAKHWKKVWGDQPVTIDAVICFGVDESDDTVNTVDTGRRRTGADMLYRSHFLKNVEDKHKKAVARILEFGVRTLWHRTGVSANAFAPTLTHSELSGFIETHPKLVDCAIHIHEEDAKKELSKNMPLGLQAGLMYLFSASASAKDAADKWRMNTARKEKMLDLSNLPKAEEFFTLIGGNSPEMKEYRTRMAELYDEETGKGATKAEKIALTIKAWNSFIESGKVKFPTPALKYKTDGDSNSILIEHPDCGGVDLGEPKEVEETPEEAAEKDEQHATASQPPTSKPKLPPLKAPSNQPKAPEPMRDVLKNMRTEHENVVLMFEDGSGYTVWGGDCGILRKECNLQPVMDQVQKMNRVSFAKEKLEEITARLREREYGLIGIVRPEGEGWTVERLDKLTGTEA